MRNALRFAGLLLLCGVAAACYRPSPFRDFDYKATVTGPATVKVGATAQYTATVTMDGFETPTGPAARVNLSWSSSNTAVATVSSSGLVTGVTPGLVTISALPVDDLVGDARTAGTIALTIVP